MPVYKSIAPAAVIMRAAVIGFEHRAYIYPGSIGVIAAGAKIICVAVFYIQIFEYQNSITWITEFTQFVRVFKNIRIAGTVDYAVAQRTGSIVIINCSSAVHGIRTVMGTFIGTVNC